MTNEEYVEQLEYISDTEQELSKEEQKLIDTIYDRLDIFEQQNRSFHETARECREIIHMEDPYQDDPKTVAANGKKTLQLQTLKSTVNNVVADQMLSMPEAKLLPETPGMQDAADDLQDLVHHVMYSVNDYEHIHYRRCEDFYGPGTAITQTAWDPDMSYGKGDIAIIRWPLEAFLWDPMADNIQDCRAVMKVSWHPLSYYRAHWPDKGKYVEADDGTHNGVGMTEGQEDAEHADDEKRALLIEYWWREYSAKTKRYTINVAYAAGNALLDVQKDVYAHGLYPFTIDVHDNIEGALVGEGLVHQLVTLMRYINRYAAYADMNARRASKGRLLVKRSAGIDKEALTDWENDVIEGDSIQTDSIVWMQNQPFNGTITQLMTMMQSDLKADSGANQFTRGETTGGIVSGKAINSLIQAGGKISSMRTENLKYGSKEMVKQIIWLMAQFYDEDRVMMITGRNGDRELKLDTKKLFGKKTKGAVNPPPYTVQIEITSKDPQRIANQNQMFMEAFTMAAQTNNPMRLSDLFRILNLDGKDKILPVILANEHYQEMMMQMQQQLEQMGAQMQNLQNENANLKKGTAIMKNSLNNMNARNPNNQTSAVVDAARNNLGLPTGAELPT